MENGSLKDEVKKIIQWFYELHQIKILLIKDLCIQPSIVRPSLWATVCGFGILGNGINSECKNCEKCITAFRVQEIPIRCPRSVFNLKVPKDYLIF